MKQLYIQNATQHPMGIQDAFSVKNQSNIRRNSNRLAILSPNLREGEAQLGKVAGHGGNLCKGPPGRPRSPGMFPEHPPDGGGITPDRVPNPVGGNTPRNTEIRFLNNIKFNYYSQSNFTIMKKYLFILILAVFASVTVAFGQAVQGTAPRPLACQDDALHPIAGKPYQYYLDAATQSGGNFTWWATKDPDFITTTGGTTSSNISTALLVGAGKDIINATNYGTAGASATTTITWSSDLLARTKYQAAPGANPSPTFVAAYYTPPSGTGFCADNFKVYELDPLNGFTVDILNLNPTTKLPDAGTYSYTAEQCVDNVRSATYTAAKQVLFDYGTNVLYYEVVAANFSEEWTPTFLLGGLDAKQKADIEWSYDTTFGTTVSVTSNAGNGEYASPSPALVGGTVTNTSLGVSIYVRVTVHNLKYETLAVNTISLGVAGQNKELLWDIDNNNPATANCSTPATKTTLFHKVCK